MSLKSSKFPTMHSPNSSYSDEDIEETNHSSENASWWNSERLIQVDENPESTPRTSQDCSYSSPKISSNRYHQTSWRRGIAMTLLPRPWRALSTIMGWSHGSVRTKCNAMNSNKCRSTASVAVAAAGFLTCFYLLMVMCPSETELLPVVESDMAAARLYELIDAHLTESCNEFKLARWEFATNITEETRERAVEAAADFARVRSEMAGAAHLFKPEKMRDPELSRIFQALQRIGPQSQDDTRMMQQADELKARMEDIYSSATICSFKKRKKCGLSLKPDLSRRMRVSRNPEELQWIWEQWRKASGGRLRGLYKEFIAVTEKKSVENRQALLLLEQVMPLYKQLHAFVRKRLRDFYGPEIVPTSGHILVHLLGNMWGQDWMSISDLLLPFPERKSKPLGKRMRAQNYTVEKMYKMAEDFFISLNFSALPPSFWEQSMIQKPKDGRRVMCQPSAWDLCDGQDFRIKMCTEVSFKDLLIVTHEVGHVQYYMEYSQQPFVFRQGAKPAFHEAIGDTLVLSFLTPDHLIKTGLLAPEEWTDDEADNLNFLMEIALKKLPLVAFSYVMYKWRHDVMSKAYSTDQLNCHWWELMETFQGIKAPGVRSEEDFDPGSKWHVIADLPFLRYEFSKILEFQFHKALCQATEQYPDVPLHKCNVYGSKVAGEKFRALLQVGYSEAWEDTLEDMTGVPDMDVRPMLEYFKPLERYLAKENMRTNEVIGWGAGVTWCPNN